MACLRLVTLSAAEPGFEPKFVGFRSQYLFFQCLLGRNVEYYTHFGLGEVNSFTFVALFAFISLFLSIRLHKIVQEGSSHCVACGVCTITPGPPLISGTAMEGSSTRAQTPSKCPTLSWYQSLSKFWFGVSPTPQGPAHSQQSFPEAQGS